MAAPDSGACREDLALTSALRDRLRAAELAWPGPLHAYERLDSTSDQLKRLAACGAPHGSVVLARTQTTGRGRHGHTWRSPAGNLYISWLLRPPASLALTLLPLAIGVAVSDALGAWGVEARLKWPNDLLAGAQERKLAGVLTEATSVGGLVETVVIGVGVNLSWDPRDDVELHATATSVLLESGHAPEITEAAATLLRTWSVWYHALVHDAHSVVAAWRARAVPWWGQLVEVRGPLGVESGRLLGVDPDGALLLERAGTTHRLLSGEVSRLRRAE